MRSYYTGDWAQPTITISPLKYQKYEQSCLDTKQELYQGFVIDIIPDEEIIDAVYPDYFTK